MITTAIIAEFNPFHNGHKYLLENAKKNTNADFLVVIMSGSFVQRGEPAILSKRARVMQALKEGADLVLELPVEYAVSSAQGFARGAIGILDATGIINNLYFGSESGDIELLSKAADGLLSADFDELIKKELKKGVSYPAARQKVLEDKKGYMADCIKKSNNLLGIEYMLAIKYFNSSIIPYTECRVGIDHDSNKADNSFASALFCRNLIRNNESVKSYLPPDSFEILAKEIVSGCAPVFIENMEKAIVTCLKRFSLEDFKNIPGVSEGLEFSLLKACKENSSLDAIISAVKSKRYTYSRIKRILIMAFLKIKKNNLNYDVKPEYIRILGMKKSASDVVRKLREKAKLPIIQNLSAEDIIPNGLELEVLSTELWNLFTHKPVDYGEDYRKYPIVID